MISTPSRLQIFNSIVQALGLKSKSGLILDVPHRWNATYDMLNEALKYKAALNRYATQQHHECPTEEDWSKAEALHGFLQEFSDATKAFSADRHPTTHLFLKMLLDNFDRMDLLLPVGFSLFIAEMSVFPRFRGRFILRLKHLPG